MQVILQLAFLEWDIFMAIWYQQRRQLTPARLLYLTIFICTTNQKRFVGTLCMSNPSVLCLTMSISTANHQKTVQKHSSAPSCHFPPYSPVQQITIPVFQDKGSNSSAFTMTYHLLLIDGNHSVHPDHDLIFHVSSTLPSLLLKLLHEILRFTGRFPHTHNNMGRFHPL